MNRRNIQTENFCINDLQNDFMIAQTLSHVMDQLETVTEWVWSNRFQNEYYNLCGHYITEKSTGFIDEPTPHDWLGIPPQPYEPARAGNT